MNIVFGLFFRNRKKIRDEWQLKQSLEGREGGNRNRKSTVALSILYAICTALSFCFLYLLTLFVVHRVRNREKNVSLDYSCPW